MSENQKSEDSGQMKGSFCPIFLLWVLFIIFFVALLCLLPIPQNRTNAWPSLIMVCFFMMAIFLITWLLTIVIERDYLCVCLEKKSCFVEPKNKAWIRAFIHGFLGFVFFSLLQILFLCNFILDKLVSFGIDNSIVTSSILMFWFVAYALIPSMKCFDKTLRQVGGRFELFFKYCISFLIFVLIFGVVFLVFGGIGGFLVDSLLKWFSGSSGRITEASSKGLSDLSILAAVIGLVVSALFKDSLLGFYVLGASIWHDALRIGDWLEVEDLKVVGTVIDITPTRIKIVNKKGDIENFSTAKLMMARFSTKRWKEERPAYSAYCIKEDVLVRCSINHIEKLKRNIERRLKKKGVTDFKIDITPDLRDPKKIAILCAIREKDSEAFRQKREQFFTVLRRYQDKKILQLSS